MNDKLTRAVLREFGAPPEIEESRLPSPQPSEVLVRIKAAGVCGSDLHIASGRDPRIKLPLVLGHEGVGEVAEIAGERRDVFGRVLSVGDLVIWDRGVVCGQCYYCAVRRQAFLCPRREVYGISRDGCYATHLLLSAATRIIALPAGADPAALVAAACSGATAAHAFEYVHLTEDDTVLVQGPGPLGMFAVAMARSRGAGRVVCIGTERSRKRLELAREFGADEVMTTDGSTLAERMDLMRSLTRGFGPRVAIDCAGRETAFAEGIEVIAPGGIYLLPGVAAPVPEVPLRLYEQVVRKHVTLQGVWVSDTAHLVQAVELVLSRRFPFARLVTHRFPLESITEALAVVESREALKGVLEP
ncbi:MAG: zinc-binding dehydrogenase [Armatimonadota bacterium]|nr:MAG: zinc-binding dehydrogenase [Armatimonadota bacterium]